MLFVTDIDEQITIKCSCGCFSLAIRNPAIVSRGIVRCLICGARAPLSTLVREWLSEGAQDTAPAARAAATPPSRNVSRGAAHPA